MYSKIRLPTIQVLGNTIMYYIFLPLPPQTRTEVSKTTSLFPKDFLTFLKLIKIILSLQQVAS